MRLVIAQSAVTMLESTDDSDPRRAEALLHYKAQLASLEAEMAQRFPEASQQHQDSMKERKDKPEGIVVHLKPAILFPKAGKIGDKHE
jgi:hypothetical protein